MDWSSSQSTGLHHTFDGVCTAQVGSIEVYYLFAREKRSEIEAKVNKPFAMSGDLEMKNLIQNRYNPEQGLTELLKILNNYNNWKLSERDESR